MDKVKDVTNAKEYNIYAGLGGGFGGARYQYTGLFNSEEEALEEAYAVACEEYEAYEGTGGIMTYEDALKEAEGDESIANEILEQEKDDWISYEVALTSEDGIPEDFLIRDHIIEDGDSVGEANSQGS